MTLHELRVFSMVMKLRGVNNAARHLGISQPSVSLLLKALERSVGVKLYEKIRNKRIQPTAAGAKVLEYAEEAILRVDRLQEDLEQLQGLKKGKLTIGGAGLPGMSFLPEVVKRFEKLYPGVDIFLRIEPTRILTEMLLEGEIDLAVLALSHDYINHKAILVEPYCEEDIVLIAPANHPLAKKRSVPLSLLVEERFILGKKGESRIRQELEAILAEKGLALKSSMEINIRSGRRYAINTAVAKGLGIGMVCKSYTTADVKLKNLKILNVPELNIKREIFLAVHKNRQTPLCQRFRELLITLKEQLPLPD